MADSGSTSTTLVSGAQPPRGLPGFGIRRLTLNVAFKLSTLSVTEMTRVGGLPEQPCIGHTTAAYQIHLSARRHPGPHSAVNHFAVFGSVPARTLQLGTAMGENADVIAATEPKSCGSTCRFGMGEDGACAVALPEQERSFNRDGIEDLDIESSSDDSKN